MIAVTLDTSFYIGAVNSRGAGSRLLSMALAGEFRVDISEPIMTETLRVLREKFGWDGYRINHLRQTLSRITNRVAPEQTLDVIKEDPSDNRILEMLHCHIEKNPATRPVFRARALKQRTHDPPDFFPRN